MSEFQYHINGETPTENDLIIRVPAGIVEKSQLFFAIAEGLSFPPYFGNNWDAFEECLSDLSWLNSCVIVLWHDDLPLIGSKHDISCYIKILLDLEPTDHGVTIKASFPASLRKDLELLTRTL